MVSPNPETAGQGTHLPILGLIESVQEACRADVPREKFVREMLRAFVALSDAVYGAFWAIDAATHNLGIATELMPHVSQDGARGWAPTLGELAVGSIQQTLIRYQSVSEPAGQLLAGKSYMALAFPVRGDETAAGCITLVVRGDNPILSGAGIAMLQVVADFGLLYSAVRAAARFQKSYMSLSGAWEVVGEALAFATPLEMAQVLADRTRASLDVQRVSIGLAKGAGVAVTAVSGEDILDKRSNFVRLIEAAQTEVAVSGEAALYTTAADSEERARQVTRNPQHERLARDSGAQAVYSAPLRKGTDLIGVLTVEFGTGAAFADDLRQVVDVAAGQAGPLLHLARENDRGVIRRAGDGIGEAARWVFGREHPWHKAAAAGALVLVGVGIFGRTDFNAVGNCRLECSFRQVHAAPFETTIRAVSVRPGDTVAEGQLIVEFDRDDVMLQLRETRSNMTSADKEMSTYLAQQKMPQYAEMRARRDALAAEAELLERKVSRAEIRADFAGIVVAGDLTQDIGRPVRMGEPLIEIAPLHSLFLDVEIDQGDITYVRLGQEGRFTTKARPDVSIPFAVSKVRPMSEVRGGRSVYIAEATVPNPEGWLRPGMEGAAKVRIERRNILWVYSRKLVNWLRMRLWW